MARVYLSACIPLFRVVAVLGVVVVVVAGGGGGGGDGGAGGGGGWLGWGWKKGSISPPECLSVC